MSFSQRTSPEDVSSMSPTDLEDKHIHTKSVNTGHKHEPASEVIRSGSPLKVEDSTKYNSVSDKAKISSTSQLLDFEEEQPINTIDRNFLSRFSHFQRRPWCIRDSLCTGLIPVEEFRTIYGSARRREADLASDGEFEATKVEKG